MRNAYAVVENKIRPFKSRAAVKVYDQMCDELAPDWIITEERYKFPTELTHESFDLCNRMFDNGVLTRAKCVFSHWLGNVSPSKALYTHKLLFPIDLCPLILPPPTQLSQQFHIQHFPQQTNSSSVVRSHPRGTASTAGDVQFFCAYNSKEASVVQVNMNLWAVVLASRWPWVW